MNTEQTTPEAGEKPFFRRLRESVLPVRPDDNALVKLGKNAGFALFLVMCSFVSIMILTAVTLAM